MDFHETASNKTNTAMPTLANERAAGQDPLRCNDAESEKRQTACREGRSDYIPPSSSASVGSAPGSR